jgi:hypothetical protein
LIFEYRKQKITRRKTEASRKAIPLDAKLAEVR